MPLPLATMFDKALKMRSKGVVEFDIYPRGGPVLYEQVMQREQMRRSLEWFEQWLQPGR